MGHPGGLVITLPFQGHPWLNNNSNSKNLCSPGSMPGLMSSILHVLARLIFTSTFPGRTPERSHNWKWQIPDSNPGSWLPETSFCVNAQRRLGS